ncbi:FAD-dependent oxidoreductase [Chryseolinea lacunae]|uniref:Kynurenine 3-monooxygenase n=1 Tax=Chryseolinea lacunae TaxID=2801331 RepID=A0ABS1KVK6_9BACT|nr:FAD-dependent monooxygenase [Chryseolinea lacunae]
MKTDKHIAIAGAGPVGSLLALYLAKRGYRVDVFERRPDLRAETLQAGRSINLALSTRGIRALDEVGLGDALRRVAIPMHGRVMHSVQGQISSLPYGKQGQFINSISRSGLNVVLINGAEAQGVNFHFNQRVAHVDLQKTTLTLQQNGGEKKLAFDAIIGADGAFSAVRAALQFTDRVDYSQDYIDHGYKELHIPAGPNGSFLLEKNALHIWPRESFMMIALPNPDGSFTCTLFFPFEGATSFASLKTNEDIVAFFKNTFPDAVALMPDLLHDYQTNPTSSLVTMKCYPWVKNKTLVIGDAAHAVVPFYGQGMNAGFEDCRVLNELLDTHHDDWDVVLPMFQSQRKQDTDAIAQLALDNFIEMRDLVADADFLLRKKIEARLHELYPEQWIPQYSMVTFHDTIRYSEAQALGRKQKRIMDDVMKLPHLATTWQSLDFQQLVRRMQEA